MGDNEMRCTDEKLFQLCERFDQHVERFEQHERNEQQGFDRLITAQQANTVAIADLTSSTREVVDLHKKFQGAAYVGRGVQGFMLWCLKWGLIGTAFVAGIDWLVTRFTP